MHDHALVARIPLGQTLPLAAPPLPVHPLCAVFGALCLVRYNICFECKRAASLHLLLALHVVCARLRPGRAAACPTLDWQHEGTGLRGGVLRRRIRHHCRRGRGRGTDQNGRLTTLGAPNERMGAGRTQHALHPPPTAPPRPALPPRQLLGRPINPPINQAHQRARRAGWRAGQRGCRPGPRPGTRRRARRTPRGRPLRGAGGDCEQAGVG